MPRGGVLHERSSFVRDDDIRAKFSSRGPAFPLQNAKPDILAGGVGLLALADLRIATRALIELKDELR